MNTETPNLVLATSGPLDGYTVCPVDWAKFADFKSRCYSARIRYGYGSKDPRPGSGAVDFTEIDCSGFVRSLLMYATGGYSGALRGMPDGSALQGDWFAAKGFKPTTRQNLLKPDGHLRVAVHRRDGLDSTGHVWLTCNGHTVESYGGHGPGERNPECRLHGGETLGDLVTVAFVLC